MDAALLTAIGSALIAITGTVLNYRSARDERKLKETETSDSRASVAFEQLQRVLDQVQEQADNARQRANLAEAAADDYRRALRDALSDVDRLERDARGYRSTIEDLRRELQLTKR